MTGGVGYKSSLTEYVINKINESEIAKQQRENKKINVFTGLEFNEKNQDLNIANLPEAPKAYLSSLSQEELAKIMQSYTENNNATYEGNLTKLGAVDLEEPSRNILISKKL